MDGRELFLDVDSAQAVFDTERDTIYWYDFIRSGQTLDLTGRDGVRSTTRIETLTGDSLVLTGVPTPYSRHPLRFWRAKPRPVPHGAEDG